MTGEKIYSLFLFMAFIFIGFGATGSTPDTLSDLHGNNSYGMADTNELYQIAHENLLLSKKDKNESSLIDAYLDLARFHDNYGELDSAIFYYQQLKNIYINAGMDKAVAESCLELKGLYSSKAAYNKCMVEVFEALEYYESVNDQKGIAICYTHLCDLLYYEYKYQESADYCDKAIAIQEEIKAREDLAVSYRYKASSLLFVDGALDEALATINKAIKTYHELGENGMPLLASLNGRGNILKYMGWYDDAIADYQYIYDRCIEMGQENFAIPPIANIGHVYVMQEKFTEALPYNLKAIEMMKKSGNTKNLWENYMHVSDIYKGMGDYNNAYKYHALYSEEYSNYLFTIIDRLESEAQIKYETAQKDEMINRQGDKIAYQKRTQLLYISIAVLLIVSLLGMIRSRIKIRKKQKEIERSKIELQNSLENLKTTQTQLIHAEKMASLGELTAGIAHEIQNPLNFVKNFSEVNAELILELKEEIDKGDLDEVKAIANDIADNEQKIIHHGKRADSIVKGMLQHSRSSSNQKVPTDVNALADEYLRLSYHGLRAKDKSFNANFNTDFDEHLPQINVVSQDIGRVLLNLFNNAFYAVAEKQKLQKENYKPLVVVKTKTSGDKIEISVKDNGNGIPDKVKDKIFQPFFTTKPTGEGTGLGLSLSYDIVSKGHGGDLRMETEEGVGTEFIISIPNP
jgi:signal transduction histidine kinase/tetratricopeptide (TPR) repeat protein